MNSFFQPKDYRIEIQDENTYFDKFAPQFKVTIYQSAINKTFEALAEKFKQPLHGVSFKIINSNETEITITFNAAHQATDKAFRETLAKFTQYKMTSETCEEILKQYEAYVKKYANKLDLPMPANTQHHRVERSSRNASCA